MPDRWVRKAFHGSPDRLLCYQLGKSVQFAKGERPMKYRIVTKPMVAAFAGVAMIGFLSSSALAAWPDKPIEMVCATSAKSGAAHWCRLMSTIISKELGTRVDVLFEGGGGNTAWPNMSPTNRRTAILGCIGIRAMRAT
jgi:hypothetical protein